MKPRFLNAHLVLEVYSEIYCLQFQLPWAMPQKYNIKFFVKLHDVPVCFQRFYLYILYIHAYDFYLAVRSIKE